MGVTRPTMLESGMPRISRVVAWLAVALLLGYGVAPAIASRGPHQGGGMVDPSVHPGRLQAQITFVKRFAHPWDSRIEWTARRQRADGSWKVLAQDSWRAGSGLPGRRATDPCAKNRGWLPDGRYSLRQYDDYAGSLIHGRAFRLSDK